MFSSAEFACTFDPVSGPNESFTGSVSKIGVDLTDDKVETIVWYVFAPSADTFGARRHVGIRSGALERARERRAR